MRCRPDPSGGSPSIATFGTRDVDDLLGEASQALDKLERRLRKVTDLAEQTRLNRQIGFGRMVFAFEHQDGAGAAAAISGDLLEWSDDPDAERQVQAGLLRELVPVPSPQDAEDE